MKKWTSFSVFTLYSLLLVGCSTSEQRPIETTQHKERKVAICGTVGGLVGVVGGATIQGSTAAGWGALGGALVGAYTCLSQHNNIMEVEPDRKGPHKHNIVLDSMGIGFFDFDSAELKHDMKAQLKLLTRTTKAHKGSIIIYGYTDDKGSAAYNMDLSLRRAKTIKDYLLSLGGFMEHKITIKGMGKSYPVASNKTPLGRAKNRRIEIELR